LTVVAEFLAKEKSCLVRRRQEFTAIAAALKDSPNKFLMFVGKTPNEDCDLVAFLLRKGPFGGTPVLLGLFDT
jgi:hypothetical protein